MSTSIYIRPIGRLTRPPGRINASPDKVVRIAEREDLVFTALELIQRHGDGWSDSRIVSIDEARGLISQQSPAADALLEASDRFAAPRGPIAGMALDRPRIMGVINVTPDSFSDGGHFLSAKEAIAHGLKLEEDGADMLDIGGESTRPGAQPVPLDEELARVMPVLEGLAGRTRCRLSIDTRKAEVMRRAASAGAHILNDISALTNDPRSLRIAAESKLPIVLMHSQGDPATMQRDPRYQNVLLDVYDQLAARVDACIRAGIARERLIVDPGIGFGKTLRHNLELMAGLALFHGLGVPLLLGASRKRWIGTLTQEPVAADRVIGSAAAAVAGAGQGVQIVRVHDVKATRQALAVATASWSGREAETMLQKSAN